MEREHHAERYPVKTTWIDTWVEMRSLEKPLSLARIGRWYGVSASIVYRYTKDKVRRPEGWGQGNSERKFDWDEARRMDEAGTMSRAEIARRLGVSGARITQVLGPKARRAA